MSATAVTWSAVVVLWFAAPLAAQPAGNLQRALDTQVDLQLQKVPIGQVFQRLTQQTGVRFVLGEDVYASLPYAEQTRVSVTLRKATLRDALSRMLASQAMEWVVEKQAVRIPPSPALLRMNRRATIDEFDALGRIHSVTMQPTARGGAVIDQLRKATGNKELSLLFHGEPDEAAQKAAIQRAERTLPSTAAVWLDMLCHGRGWTWYLWGDDIMIVDKKIQVTRQLGRAVSLRYENAKLVTVLLDLARKARVKLTMDPGVMDYVSEETLNNFNLMMTDATIAQALEVISGATGLKFTTHADGIGVEASEQLKQRASGAVQGAAQKTPFFLKKSVKLPDGSTIELLLRPEDLPEDVQAAILAERSRLMKLVAETFKPTTQPAAKPPSK